jgi:predicted O-methyltransferase YrrM
MTFWYKNRTVLQLPDEIVQLKDVMKEVGVKSVLDIGFYNGGTVLMWNDMIENGLIIGMDLQRQNVAELEYIQRELKLKNNRFVFVECDSTLETSPSLLVKSWPTDMLPPSFDMILIDGDHRGEAPIKDWNNYRQFVLAGGIIAWHDINDKSVRAHYDKACEGKKHKEFISPNNPLPGWNGLGCIYV